MSDNIHQIFSSQRAEFDRVKQTGGGGPVDSGGSPPHDGAMDKRVEKLEEFAQDAKDRLIKIETRLDQVVTKADLSDAMNAQIKWMVGTAVVLGVAAITIMTFVLNNAVPKPPAAAPLQPAPIVIYTQQPAPQTSPLKP